MEKKGKKFIKGKLNHQFGDVSLDIDSFDDICDNNESLPFNEKDNLKIKSPQNSQKNDIENLGISGKINRIFFHYNPYKKLIHEQSSKSRNKFQENNPDDNKPITYVYNQMKLNVEQTAKLYQNEIDEYRLSGIKVRKAEKKDLTIIVSLYNRSFMNGADPWNPGTLRQFEEIMALPFTAILIGSTYGEDIGFIITALEGENLDIGFICGLGVDPRWQRRGFARFLCIASWDYFLQKKIKEIRCEVYEKNNISYKLIKSLHFEEYGKKSYDY